MSSQTTATPKVSGKKAIAKAVRNSESHIKESVIGKPMT